MYNLQYIMRNLHDVMLAINAITHDVIGNLHTAMEFYNYNIVKGLRLITSLLSQYRFYCTANLLTYGLSSGSISENCVRTPLPVEVPCNGKRRSQSILRVFRSEKKAEHLQGKADTTRDSLRRNLLKPAKIIAKILDDGCYEI